jgi:hypothetical protein
MIAIRCLKNWLVALPLLSEAARSSRGLRAAQDSPPVVDLPAIEPFLPRCAWGASGDWKSSPVAMPDIASIYQASPHRRGMA